MKIYTFDARTLAYTGDAIAQPLPENPDMLAMPECSTTVPPAEDREGFSQHFDAVSSVWFYRQAWRAPEPTPQSQQEIDAMRAEEVRARLLAIDAASVRPARAVALALAAGEAVDDLDREQLLDLEEEAAALRFELHSLTT
ncbi:hypothetical protein [Lacisediminimonas profundi]|uniref:hypothetical protein n=1 Tax=Lacisediminimonas profundi TaxID=2603856 RepID=UPI00124AF75D|nr:hypothetical protein [Lacisediminimonas profundi]